MAVKKKKMLQKCVQLFFFFLHNVILVCRMSLVIHNKPTSQPIVVISVSDIFHVINH